MKNFPRFYTITTERKMQDERKVDPAAEGCPGPSEGRRVEREYSAGYWEGQADAISAILAFEFEWYEGEEG